MADSGETVRYFVINLDRSPDRLGTSTKRLAAIGVPFERVAAVDGRSLGPGPWPEVDSPTFRRNAGRGFSANEIACNLSHIKALKQFLATRAEYAVVLEDDFVLPPGRDFGELINALATRPREWDIAKLYGNRPCAPVHKRHLVGKYTLAAPLLKYTGAVAYMVNRHGASEIVRMATPITLGFDHYLDQPWIYRAVKYRVVLPRPVDTDTSFKSSIGYPDSKKYLPIFRIPALIHRMRVGLARLFYNARHGFFLLPQ